MSYRCPASWFLPSPKLLYILSDLIAVIFNRCIFHWFSTVLAFNRCSPAILFTFVLYNDHFIYKFSPHLIFCTQDYFSMSLCSPTQIWFFFLGFQRLLLLSAASTLFISSLNLFKFFNTSSQVEVCLICMLWFPNIIVKIIVEILVAVTLLCQTCSRHIILIHLKNSQL